MKYENQSKLGKFTLRDKIDEVRRAELALINMSVESQLEYLTEKLGKDRVQRIINDAVSIPSVPKDCIVIFENETIAATNGNVTCTGYIKPAGYIPDLYVLHDSHEELYDDSKFMAGVDKVLKKLGYKGGTKVDRAELGMQRDKRVAIEPDQKLSDFFVKKFGFKDR